jgi:hypothetical protein
LPTGRNNQIPLGAIDQGDGTSQLDPSGSTNTRWVFGNSTGIIIRICDLSNNCIDGKWLLMSGYVRFSTGFEQPKPSQAELPTSDTLPSVSVKVSQSSPFSGTVNCFEDAITTAGTVAYLCAIPITDAQQFWSGRTKLGGISIVSRVDDDNDNKFKVCRYTRDRAHTAVNTGSPVMTNVDHPRDYLDVNTLLSQQNYLVIRAGDGDTAFECPEDDTSTPFVSGRTWYHQPAD